uniref:Uncharacterized protein n=1 Tax=Naja naja TaxID=35670 RepID=A0A8C7E723_NAJNA
NVLVVTVFYVDALKSTYKLIKSAHDGKSALDSLESFSFDLYVLCAEQAYQMGLPEISHDCLQMYFKGKAPVNQFLGRAYLCQSQLYTPVSTDNLEQFEKFNINLLKAIDFALNDSRYYFLIYNASVIYWKNIRPFLKPGSLYFLIPSLSQIVSALNHPDEEDKDWTAELMIELLECFLDASRMEEAITFSSTAATFIEENAPSRYKDLFSIMVIFENVTNNLNFPLDANRMLEKLQVLKVVFCLPFPSPEGKELGTNTRTESHAGLSPKANLLQLIRLLAITHVPTAKFRFVKYRITH